MKMQISTQAANRVSEDKTYHGSEPAAVGAHGLSAQAASGPFFITGSQRSGTTLLRLILNAHSRVAIPEEGTFWMPLLRAHRHDYERPLKQAVLDRYLAYIAKNDQFRTWDLPMDRVTEDLGSRERVTLADFMEAFYVAYARLQRKPYWGDKTPSFFRKIDQLARIFPNARFIHVIRDGRDVFLSMRRLEPSRKNVAVAALEWKYKLERARKSLLSLPEGRTLEIRFEDVLHRPEETLAEICRFVGIHYERSMLDFYQTSRRYIGEHHSALIFKPLSTEAAERWKSRMVPRENKTFEALAGGSLRQCGYQTRGNGKLAVREFLTAIRLLCTGLPLRSFQVVITALSLQLALLLRLQTGAAGGKRR